MQKGRTSAIEQGLFETQVNRQATDELLTQNTTGLCSQFLATQKEPAPGTSVHIPQLSSKGVMSHILGARANFFLIMGYLH